MLFNVEEVNGFNETIVDRAMGWLEGMTSLHPELQERFEEFTLVAGLYAESWDIMRVRNKQAEATCMTRIACSKCADFC